MINGKIKITVKDGVVREVGLVEYNNRFHPERPTSIIPLKEGEEFEIVDEDED